jgi:HSP20 family protein
MLLTSFDPFAEFYRELRAADSETMRMDAVRRDSEIEFRFDLPGIDVRSIDVTVDDGVLVVTAERAEEYADGERPFVRERVMGSFTRRIRLSDAVDTEKIAAAYDDGVLTVTVPLTDRARPRKIEINAPVRAAVTA